MNVYRLCFGVTAWMLAYGFEAAGAMVLAQGGPPPHVGSGQGAGPGRVREVARESALVEAEGRAVEDVYALERFLSMSDAELDAVAAAVARVRALTPAERAELKARLKRFAELPPGERAQVRRGWVDEAERRAWRMYLDGLSAAEREAIAKELRALPLEERARRRTEILRAAGQVVDNPAAIESK